MVLAQKHERLVWLRTLSAALSRASASTTRPRQSGKRGRTNIAHELPMDRHGLASGSSNKVQRLTGTKRMAQAATLLELAVQAEDTTDER